MKSIDAPRAAERAALSQGQAERALVEDAPASAVTLAREAAAPISRRGINLALCQTRALRDVCGVGSGVVAFALALAGRDIQPADLFDRDGEGLRVERQLSVAAEGRVERVRSPGALFSRPNALPNVEPGFAGVDRQLLSQLDQGWLDRGWEVSRTAASSESLG